MNLGYDDIGTNLGYADNGTNQDYDRNGTNQGYDRNGTIEKASLQYFWDIYKFVLYENGAKYSTFIENCIMYCTKSGGNTVQILESKKSTVFCDSKIQCFFDKWPESTV